MHLCFLAALFLCTVVYEAVADSRSQAGPPLQPSDRAADPAYADQRELLMEELKGAADAGAQAAAVERAEAEWEEAKRKKAAAARQEEVLKELDSLPEKEQRKKFDLAREMIGKALKEALQTVPDPAQNGKKCGAPGSSDRLFFLRDAAATTEACGLQCRDKSACVVWSGIVGEWCIGCKEPLGEAHAGAVAYKKAGGYKQVPLRKSSKELINEDSQSLGKAQVHQPAEVDPFTAGEDPFKDNEALQQASAKFKEYSEELSKAELDMHALYDDMHSQIQAWHAKLVPMVEKSIEMTGDIKDTLVQEGEAMDKRNADRFHPLDQVDELIANELGARQVEDLPSKDKFRVDLAKIEEHRFELERQRKEEMAKLQEARPGGTVKSHREKLERHFNAEVGTQHKMQNNRTAEWADFNERRKMVICSKSRGSDLQDEDRKLLEDHDLNRDDECHKKFTTMGNTLGLSVNPETWCVDKPPEPNSAGEIADIEQGDCIVAVDGDIHMPGDKLGSIIKSREEHDLTDLIIKVPQSTGPEIVKGWRRPVQAAGSATKSRWEKDPSEEGGYRRSRETA